MTRHDIAFVISRNGWIFIAGMAAFLVLIPFLTAGLPGDSIYNVEVTHDQLKFRLINDTAFTAVTAAAVIVGAITGGSLFRFLQDKKETTIFLSMGITRGRLFANRMIIGFLMLALMTAIPMMVSVILNINALGGYMCLIRNAVFIWAGLFLTSAVSCVIAAIMSFISGNLMELTVYWACGMSIPAILFAGINLLMKKLCWGNACGVTTYSGTEMIRESLIEKFAFLNPLLFFKEHMSAHAQFMRPLESNVPEGISWKIIIGWLSILVLLTILAWYLLTRWKAENAGITGNGKVFAEATAAMTGFILCIFVFTYLLDYNVYLAAAAGILTFVCVHLFWKKTGLLGLIKTRSQVICAGTQIAVTAVICIVLASGVFGSAEKFVAGSDVMKVKVSCTGDPSFMYEDAAGSSTGHGYYVSGKFELKDRASIEKVKALHMMFDEQGRPDMEASENIKDTVVPYDILFEYTESDGTEHTWYYDRADYGQLEKMLELEDLDEVKENRTAMFSGESTGESMSMTEQAYDFGSVFITDNYLYNTYELTLGDDKRQQLLAAIGADTAEMTSEQRYFTDKPVEAVLMFTQSGEDDCRYYAYHLNNAFVYLTADYENTLKWLDENNLLAYVAGDGAAASEIESITMQRLDPYIGISAPDYPMGMYFMSYCADTAEEFIYQKDFGKRYVITEPDEIAEITAGLKNGYYMSEGGFLVAVKLAGTDNYRYMFLPESMVPSFIRG